MRRILSLFLCLLMTLSCASFALADEAPVTLRILMPFYNAETSASIVTALEEATGVRLDITGVTYDQWDQKVNTLMAVGEPFDILIINSTAPWRSWAEEGLVHDLSTLIDAERHPYAAKIVESEMYGSYWVDDKAYYLPGAHSGQDFSWFVRSDILKAYGVDQIQTVDEFYEIAKKAQADYGILAFAGSSSEGNFEQYQPIFGAFGVGNIHPSERGFLVDDEGKVYDSAMTEGALDALKFLNTLYREDLINKDYLTIGNSYIDTYVSTGQALSFYAAGDARTADANMKLIDPSYGLQHNEPMNRDAGFVGRLGWSAMWTLACIPTTSENPEKAIDFFEYANSREGRDLLVAGPKGLTVSEDGVSEDGIYEPLPEGVQAQWGAEGATSPMWASFMCTMFGYVPVTEYDTFNEAYENRIIYITQQDLDTESPFSFRMMTHYGGMFAETTLLNTTALPIETEVKNRLNTIRSEYWNMIIMEEDAQKIDGLWAEYVAKWEENRGPDYVQAYQDFYDASIAGN